MASFMMNSNSDDWFATSSLPWEQHSTDSNRPPNPPNKKRVRFGPSQIRLYERPAVPDKAELFYGPQDYASFRLALHAAMAELSRPNQINNNAPADAGYYRIMARLHQACCQQQQQQQEADTATWMAQPISPHYDSHDKNRSIPLPEGLEEGDLEHLFCSSPPSSSLSSSSPSCCNIPTLYGLERVAIPALYQTKRDAKEQLLQIVLGLQARMLMGDDAAVMAETIRQACEPVSAPCRKFAASWALVAASAA